MTQSAQEPQPHATAEKKSGVPSQSASQSSGNAVQRRAQLRGHDFAAQEEMLSPVAQPLDVVQKKPVQRDAAPAPVTEAAAVTPATQAPAAEKKKAPPISFGVPAVAPVAGVADPVARNQIINQSYHAFDASMSVYLGEPLVSNWCTYGQHASREAGAQIKNLQGAKTLMADMSADLELFQSLEFPDSIGDLWDLAGTIKSVAKRCWKDVKIVLGLLREKGLVQQSVLLWLAKAGISEDELRSVSDGFAEALSDLEGFNILGAAWDAFEAIKKGVNIGIRMVSGIPQLLKAMDLIYANMVKGNREIYENVAPAYNSFLLAGLAAPDGVVGSMGFGGDKRGFLGAAFALYSEVRAKRNQLAEMAPDDPMRGSVRSQRIIAAHKANLLVGYQEQLVILQPIFDTMQVELQAMAGTMNLRDPNGVHPLVGGWQNFYTRMGLDPSKTPPLSEINASNLGTLKAYEKRHGTIATYFEDYVTDEKVHKAPKKIKPHG